MSIEQIGNLIIFLIVFIICIWLILWLRNKKTPLIYKKDKNLETKKNIIIKVENTTIETVYNKIIDWLTFYKSNIINTKPHSFIKASHRIDLHVDTFPGGILIREKDVIKKLEIHLQTTHDSQVIVNVSVELNPENVNRFSFTDLEWYKTELERVLNNTNKQ